MSRWLPLVLLTAAAAAAGGLWLQRMRSPGIVDVADAWRRVRDHPHDSRAWAALGDAQAAVDELRAAEEAYRTAVRLSADEPTVLARLGFLLYGRGEDAQALALLEQASHLGVDLPMLAYTIDKLRAQRRAQGGAPSPGSEQVAELQRKASDEAADARPCSLDLEARSTFRLPVRLDGREVALIFDTGASITTLSREVVEQLGLPIDEEGGIDAITAAGPIRLPIATVHRVSLAGRHLDQLTVAVCDGCGGRSAGGLLGLDVQAALGMELDLRNSRIRFLDCP